MEPIEIIMQESPIIYTLKIGPLFIFVTIILILSLISISLLLYFIKLNKLVRTRYKNGEVISIPEDFYRDNQDLKNNIKISNDKINEMFKKNFSLNQDLQQKIDSTNPRLEILTDQIKSKDSLIEKYEQGMEIVNIKRSINQFLITYDVVFSILNSMKKNEINNDEYKNIEAIHEQLKIALEMNGIEIFFPKINDDYTKSQGVSSDNLITVETGDPSQINKIVSVIKPGYKLSSNGKFLRNAQVKVFISKIKGI